MLNSPEYGLGYEVLERLAGNPLPLALPEGGPALLLCRSDSLPCLGA